MGRIHRSALALAVAAAILCAAPSDEASGRGRSGLRPDVFWARKRFETGRANIVLLGDSRLYRGLAPSVIREEIGDPSLVVFNQGYSSAGLSGVLFRQAERLLVGNRDALRCLVLGVTPHSLTPKALENEHFASIAEPEPAWFSVSSWPPHEILRGLLHKHRINPNVYYQRYHEDGWVESDYATPKPTVALAEYKSAFAGNRIAPDAVERLLRRIEAWTAEGILVIAFRPPSSEAMEALEERETAFRGYRLPRRIADAGGHWIEIERDRYASYDGSHLRAESAIRLSKRIARAIRALRREASRRKQR